MELLLHNFSIPPIYCSFNISKFGLAFGARESTGLSFTITGGVNETCSTGGNGGGGGGTGLSLVTAGGGGGGVNSLFSIGGAGGGGGGAFFNDCAISCPVHILTARMIIIFFIIVFLSDAQWKLIYKKIPPFGGTVQLVLVNNACFKNFEFPYSS